MKRLTSLQNPQIKHASRLRLPRERRQQKLFLVEGWREINSARRGGFAIETLFVCPPLLGQTYDPAAIDDFQSAGIEVFEVSPELLSKITYRQNPQGAVAVAIQKHFKLDDLPINELPLLLIAEGIEKPGNLGSLLRIADGAGADGVILCNGVTDIYNPNTVRASTGVLFTMPLVEASTSETIDWLQKREIQLIAAAPAAGTDYTQVDMRGPTAMAVGSEDKGLSNECLRAAEKTARIPMLGSADSLNVAVSAALLLFEAARQRRS